MRNLILLLTIAFLIACKGSDKGNSDTKKYLSHEDMPNAATTYETIETTDVTDNTALLTFLQEKLEKAGFRFEEAKDRGGWSYNNCEDNKIISVKGNGIRSYFSRSKQPESGTKDIYPDFSILIYEFPTKEIAQKNYDIIYKALYSRGAFCNGKAPDNLVINGNEIFHLYTRAEMFRTYTERYGDLIQNFGKGVK
ncbi:hypothetical protein [Sphingobacterium spiritivorum]|uniref:hypothetical protein n=1 Tax=Sphingobacterium spiritivorum TaxID=258 RepID=UPI00191A1B33|nr:hypothetical protein [Sphingobacterium spiritivorum]QQT25749.1 hypothetical protein I6J02_18850 [Sphingobacterium spiritivorum]